MVSRAQVDGIFQKELTDSQEKQSNCQSGNCREIEEGELQIQCQTGSQSEYI